jgi:hypothetical protein
MHEANKNMINICITKGSLGVNLQSVRDTNGAYIDSFYRSKDGALLPAEESHLLRAGDRIHSINGAYLEFSKINDIYKSISNSSYPINVKFRRLRPIDGRPLSLLCLIRDPHNFVFIDQFLSKYEKDTKIPAADARKGDVTTYSFDTASKILLLNMIDLVMLHTSELPPSHDHIKCKLLDDCYHSDFKFHIARLIPTTLGGKLETDPIDKLNLDALITSGQVVDENEPNQDEEKYANRIPTSPDQTMVIDWLSGRVQAIYEWLQADLNQTFMPLFSRSDSAAKMLGCRGKGKDAQEVFHFKMTDLLHVPRHDPYRRPYTRRGDDGVDVNDWQNWQSRVDADALAAYLFVFLCQIRRQGRMQRVLNARNWSIPPHSEEVGHIGGAAPSHHHCERLLQEFLQDALSPDLITMFLGSKAYDILMREVQVLLGLSVDGVDTHDWTGVGGYICRTTSTDPATVNVATTTAPATLGTTPDKATATTAATTITTTKATITSAPVTPVTSRVRFSLRPGAVQRLFRTVELPRRFSKHSIYINEDTSLQQGGTRIAEEVTSPSPAPSSAPSSAPNPSFPSTAMGGVTPILTAPTVTVAYLVEFETIVLPKTAKKRHRNKAKSSKRAGDGDDRDVSTDDYEGDAWDKSPTCALRIRTCHRITAGSASLHVSPLREEQTSTSTSTSSSTQPPLSPVHPTRVGFEKVSLPAASPPFHSLSVPHASAYPHDTHLVDCEGDCDLSDDDFNHLLPFLVPHQNLVFETRSRRSALASDRPPFRTSPFPQATAAKTANKLLSFRAPLQQRGRKAEAALYGCSLVCYKPVDSVGNSDSDDEGGSDGVDSEDDWENDGVKEDLYAWYPTERIVADGFFVSNPIVSGPPIPSALSSDSSSESSSQQLSSLSSSSSSSSQTSAVPSSSLELLSPGILEFLIPGLTSDDSNGEIHPQDTHDIDTNSSSSSSSSSSNENNSDSSSSASSEGTESSDTTPTTPRSHVEDNTSNGDTTDPGETGPSSSGGIDGWGSDMLMRGLQMNASKFLREAQTLQTSTLINISSISSIGSSGSSLFQMAAQGAAAFSMGGLSEQLDPLPPDPADSASIFDPTEGKKGGKASQPRPQPLSETGNRPSTNPLLRQRRTLSRGTSLSMPSSPTTSHTSPRLSIGENLPSKSPDRRKEQPAGMVAYGLAIVTRTQSVLSLRAPLASVAALYQHQQRLSEHFPYRYPYQHQYQHQHQYEQQTPGRSRSGSEIVENSAGNDHGNDDICNDSNDSDIGLVLDALLRNNSLDGLVAQCISHQPPSPSTRHYPQKTPVPHKHPPAPRLHPSLSAAASDIDANLVFETLNPRNIVTIFLAVLLEVKIVVVSSVSLTASLVLGEWLRRAMLPLNMCHLYIPVLPQSFAADLLECPAPFFLGIRRDSFDINKISKDVMIVDLDCGTVHLPANFQTNWLRAGKGLVRWLDVLLRPRFTLSDDVDPFLGQAASCYSPLNGGGGGGRREDSDSAYTTAASTNSTDASPGTSSSHGTCSGGGSSGDAGIESQVHSPLGVFQAFVKELLAGIEPCCVHFRADCAPAEGAKGSSAQELLVIFDELQFLESKVTAPALSSKSPQRSSSKSHKDGPTATATLTVTPSVNSTATLGVASKGTPLFSLQGQQDFLLQFLRSQCFSNHIVSINLAAFTKKQRLARPRSSGTG